MPGPMDFSLGNIPDPTAAFANGAQLGAGLRTLGLQQQMQDLTLQQQQQAIQQQQQQAQVINQLISKQSPTAQDYANASLVLPQTMREGIKQAWDMRSTDQQQSALQDTGRVFAALSNGQPQVAAVLLRDRSTLLKDTDPNQARALETMAGVVEAHPEFARSLIGMHLASLPGGDKVISNLSTLGNEQRASAKAPVELRKATADAITAEVAAGNAPTKTVLENQTAAETIETARLKRDIDRLDIQIKGADSETRRGELQLQRDKLQAELDAKAQAKAQSGQADVEAASTALQTVDSILKHPGMTGFFYGPGTLGGKMAGMVPGTDSKDFRSLIDTLKSQSFLTQIEKMRGMGQLTEIEGKKITDAVANLDPDQSEKQLRAQLGIVRNSLQKAQSRLIATGQAPTAGPGAYVMQHPTYGAVTETMVNSLMKQTPGATREQVLNFLRATGGR